MFTVFIYATAAAMLGGLDSPGGAVIAGLLIGVGRGPARPSSQPGLDRPGHEAWASPWSAIFVVLLFKPSGLFGTAKVERV